MTDKNKDLAQLAVDIQQRGRVVDSQEVTELKDEIERLWTENQRLKAEHRWIPVKERLPEGLHNYASEFVIIKYGEIGRTMGYYNWFEKKWIDHAGYKLPGVTHWMPLPEPSETDAHSLSMDKVE